MAKSFFSRVGITRAVNYEDIQYLARQIADCLIGEYENPGLSALIDQLAAKLTGGDLEMLRQRANLTADYITDIVCGLLGSKNRNPSCLQMVIEACSDTMIPPVDVVTLNHDTLLEQGLRRARVAYGDGFTRQFGEVMIWTDSYPPDVPRLFKLHGSLDWIRLALDEGNGRYQAEVRATKPDIYHLRDPNGNLLDFPLNDGRPLLLVGTFNKLYDYAAGVHGDQHSRFRARLRETDRLVVAGYGFGDKGINRAVIEWLVSPEDKRMVVVHPDPSLVVRDHPLCPWRPSRASAAAAPIRSMLSFTVPPQPESAVQSPAISSALIVVDDRADLVLDEHGERVAEVLLVHVDDLEFTWTIWSFVSRSSARGRQVHAHRLGTRAVLVAKPPVIGQETSAIRPPRRRW